MRFLLLFAVLLLVPLSAIAQGPAELESLHVALWPEFDDPRLLVILDGVLSQPGAAVRVPIPADAELNAVATSESNGGFLNAAYEIETGADGQIVVFSPQSPAFRIEYYAPLPTTSDQRLAAFSLPAGYLAAKTVSIEALIPPDATGLTADPEMQPQGAGTSGGQLFLRQIEGGSAQGFSQDLRYNNPAGALTVSETARATAAPAATAPSAAATPVAAQPAASSSRTPLLLGLGLAAILLIAAGVYGIWRTSGRSAARASGRSAVSAPTTPSQPASGRSSASAPTTPSQPASGRSSASAPTTPSQPASGRSSASVPTTPSQPASGRSSASVPTAPPQPSPGQDRFCRKCGAEFQRNDRFCRQCGTVRQ